MSATPDLDELRTIVGDLRPYTIALCCRCGTVRSTSLRGTQESVCEAAGERPERCTRVLRCETCGQRTKHAYLVGGPRRDFAETLQGPPRWTYTDARALLERNPDIDVRDLSDDEADWRPCEGHDAVNGESSGAGTGGSCRLLVAVTWFLDDGRRLVRFNAAADELCYGSDLLADAVALATDPAAQWWPEAIAADEFDGARVVACLFDRRPKGDR